MQYTTLGKSGLVVSRLALGTMTFGEGTSYGFTHSVDQERANTLVARAIEAGINIFDTANNYGSGRAEEFLGRALGSKRSDVIIATKVGARIGPGLMDAGTSYRHIIASTEASLKRLGTDYIDLLQLHVPDPLTPFEETTRALDNLVQRGLVRYVGYSNLSGWQAASMLAIQRQDRRAPFVSAQMYYSLLGRDIEYDVAPFLQHEGLGLLVWSPLAGGFLTGKYTREQPDTSGDRLASFDYLSFLSIDRERSYSVINRLREIARAHKGATPAQVALAWLLTKPYVSSIIVGASQMEQFVDNLGAASRTLREEDITALNELTEPKPLYPYRWQASDGDQVIRRALHLR